LYKRVLAAVIIILVAFAYVQWGMDYIYAYEWDKTAPVRESLANEIENTRKIIDKSVTVDENLAQKLSELNTQVDREKNKFPDSVYVTDVVDQLLHLADDTGIQIIPLRNGEWAETRLPGYMRYQIQLLVNGDVDDIVSFVDQAERTLLYSINIEYVELKWGNTDQSDNATMEASAVQGYVTVTVMKRT
jgi:Tfp pilus assembly protein PilO